MKAYTLEQISTRMPLVDNLEKKIKGVVKCHQCPMYNHDKGECPLFDVGSYQRPIECIKVFDGQ